MDWRPVGAAALAPAEVAVVLDVLSFATSVTVASTSGRGCWAVSWATDHVLAWLAAV